jgi:hypothetical protein
MSQIYLVLEDAMLDPEDPASRVDEPQRAIGPLAKVHMHGAFELVLTPAPGVDVDIEDRVLRTDLGALRFGKRFYNRWAVVPA